MNIALRLRKSLSQSTMPAGILVKGKLVKAPPQSKVGEKWFMVTEIIDGKGSYHSCLSVGKVFPVDGRIWKWEIL